jgi:hypothetical protein
MQHYSAIVVESIVVIEHDCTSLRDLCCPLLRRRGPYFSFLTRKEYEAGIFCLQNNEQHILLQRPMYMQLMASVVSLQILGANYVSAQCVAKVIKTCLGRHGFTLQELLEQEERLLRTVQGNLMPGAADGDVGQAFILHAPATNLTSQQHVCVYIYMPKGFRDMYSLVIGM